MLPLTGPGRIHSRFKLILGTLIKLSLGNILISLTWVIHTALRGTCLGNTLCPHPWKLSLSLWNSLWKCLKLRLWNLCLLPMPWVEYGNLIPTAFCGGGLALVTHQNYSLGNIPIYLGTLCLIPMGPPHITTPWDPDTQPLEQPLEPIIRRLGN